MESLLAWGALGTVVLLMTSVARWLGGLHGQWWPREGASPGLPGEEEGRLPFVPYGDAGLYPSPRAGVEIHPGRLEAKH